MSKIAKAEAQSKPLQWFRMYAEFATDPKVQMLSEADQRRFVMLLCLRCCNGDVTLHDEEVAFQLRVSVEDWAATKRTLIAKMLITEDNCPTKWDKRQYKSDRSNERVLRFRQRKKQQDVNGCNVTVTPPETETDTDTEAKADALAARAGGGLTRMAIEKKLREAAGDSLDCMRASLHDIDPIMGLIEGGLDLDKDILPAIRAKAARSRPGSMRGWKPFAMAVEDSVANRKFGKDIAAKVAKSTPIIDPVLSMSKDEIDAAQKELHEEWRRQALTIPEGWGI